jgi:threonine synthase
MTADRCSAFRGLRCVTCGGEHGPDGLLYTCPTCGPLAGTLDVLYDLAWLRGRFDPASLSARDERTLWRYHEILPIRDVAARPTIPVGLTPLTEVPAPQRRRLSEWRSSGARPGGVPPRDSIEGPPARGGNADARPEPDEPPTPLPDRLWIKDETRHPSASAKDRATAVALARARELGVSTVAAASTGNAASSLAALSAAAGMRCVIFAPASAPEAKLVQIRIHGAQLFAVQGSYGDAFELCAKVCERARIYSRNTATNPVLGEGKKTIALEIWEQLGFRAPDAVVVPVGDGCILGGVAKGFRDLFDLGMIDRLPRLIGVQADGSAALATAWREGTTRCRPVAASTVADSISVSQPRDQAKALRAVRESAGAFVVVSDGAILRAMRALASGLGLFVEPAAAAAFAGLRQGLRDEVISREEEVVLVVTGHGLKDVGAARRAAEDNPPVAVGADPGDLEKLIRMVEDGWSRFGTPR